MTKEELREKRNRTIKNINDIKAVLELDELYIDELEKENAEFKRDKEDLIFIRNQNAKCMCEDKEQLTKAKELLEDFICYANLADCNLYIKEQAEKFLSEAKK